MTEKFSESNVKRYNELLDSIKNEEGITYDPESGALTYRRKVMTKYIKCIRVSGTTTFEPTDTIEYIECPQIVWWESDINLRKNDEQLLRAISGLEEFIKEYRDYIHNLNSDPAKLVRDPLPGCVKLYPK